MIKEEANVNPKDLMKKLKEEKKANEREQLDAELKKDLDIHDSDFEDSDEDDDDGSVDGRSINKQSSFSPKKQSSFSPKKQFREDGGLTA